MVLTLDPAPNAPSYSNPDTFEPDTSNYLAWMKTIRDQLSGQALEIGDKVQSATDMTIGRLLTPGFMGLGSAIALGGTDSIMSRNLAPGFYSYVSSTVTGGPESLSFYHGLLVSRDEPSGRIGFLDWRLTATNLAIWSGSSDGTTIVWKRLDPERGSNSNGEYVRLADGTQICTIRRTVSVTTSANGNIHSSSADFGSWDFPVAFAVAPTAFANVHASSQWGQVGAVLSTNAAAVVIYSTAALSAASREVSATAIGRYK